MPSTEAPAPAAPFPPGFGLELDAATAAGDGGRVLVGGRPRRVLRLSAAGAVVAAERLGRGPGGGNTPAAGRLARRLIDAGVAHPVPPPAAGDVGDVTVVIPVHDRPAELARCLAALGGHPSVIVVDDGSHAPAAVRAAAVGTAARVLRQETAQGPAAARNAALPHVRTPLIAFLDSDCVPPPGWLAPLVAHLEDPAVVAVAPRVRGRTGVATTVGRWGAARSPLDLGDRPGRVAPGTAVSYVPTAALVVRADALGPGFDPALRHGEDVDLVWRLHDAGGRLRYVPGVVVDHEEPVDVRAFLVRRHRYGASAAPLARRHGARLAPIVLAPRPALAAVLLLAGRPRAAAVVLAAEAVRTERGLRGPGVPPGTGAGAALRATASTLDGLSRCTAMYLLPVALLTAAARPGARRAVAGLVLGAPLAEWAGARRARRTAGLGPVRWVLCRLADDVAYGSGVWAGALRTRDPRALRPVLGRSPRRRGPAAHPDRAAP